MKLIIIGDVHIAQSNHLGFIDPKEQINCRLIDYSETLNKVIDHVRVNEIDAVIFCGDYYKNRRPSNLHRRIFEEKIKQLSALGTLVFMITGNHDIVAENNSTVLDSLKLASYPNVNIYTDFGSVSLGTIHKDAINIIFAPYTNKHYYSAGSSKEAANRFEEKIKGMLECLDTSVPTILVGHNMVEGVKLGSIELNAEDEINELVLRKESFEGIDLTVMGHVHTKQIISDNPHIIYVGAIERNNFNETKIDKGFLEINTENFSAKFVKVPVRDIQDIVLTENYMEQLEACDVKNAIVRVHVRCKKEDLYKIDIEKIYEMLKKKEVYHCVSIDTDPIDRITEIDEKELENLSDRELFTEYVKSSYDGHEEIIKLGIEIMAECREGEMDA